MKYEFEIKIISMGGYYFIKRCFIWVNNLGYKKVLLVWILVY